MNVRNIPFNDAPKKKYLLRPRRWVDFIVCIVMFVLQVVLKYFYCFTLDLLLMNNCYLIYKFTLY